MRSGVLVSQPPDAPTSPNSRVGSLFPLVLTLDSGWSALSAVHPQGQLFAANPCGTEWRAGFAVANKWPVGFVNGPLPSYRSAALVKVLLERLRRAIRALRVLRST